MASIPKKQKIVGSLADKSVVEQIRRDRDHAAAAQNHRTVDMIDIKKVDNPAEKAILAEFDRRRKARTLTLPTDDVKVKLMLRNLNEAICLFGEDILDRRERLRRILSELGEDDVTRILHSLDRKEPVKSDLPNNKTWYHEGPPELLDGRIFIADYSLPRAQRRLQVALERSKKPTSEKALRRQELHKWIHSIQLHGSQTAGLRAVSFCEFSPDSKHIITSAWCGQTSIWSIPDLKKEIQLLGHSDQVGCARFHPLAYKDSTSTLTAASCDYDGRALLWAADKEEPLTELEAHGTRVSRLAFHPSGRFLATCCHDASWRLHDLTINKEILFQEGHSKAVFDIEFQGDGSLALTGGYDCYGRAWDLRTGKCIMFLEGHQQAIHTVGWHPNGYHMATGSADNSCKIWDIRMRRCIYTIPAHKSLVSRLKIDSEGEYMVTSSFDNFLKIWTTNGWQPLKNLEGHSMGVMCADISPDSKWIASASKDRSLKLWTSAEIVDSL
uniref:Pre-mRNA processing factor 4 (PRP4)-like domain-containing protein n=1 Tax=Panagrolaimus sp. ES5 TaxID=591445 RepID=A0AC34GR54_9BILA